MAKKKTKKDNHGSGWRALLGILILGASLCCVAFLYVRSCYEQFLSRPLLISGTERLVQVPKGSSARDVVEILEKARVIDSPWFMYWYLRQSSLASRLQPGNVVLTPDMTPAVLPEVFARVGKYAQKSIRIRPGMNLYDIADALQANRMADAQDFLASAFDPFTAAQYGVPAKSFEGYIAPGIYTFDLEASPEKMLAKMHEKWRSYWTSLVAAHRGAYEILLARGFDDHKLLTLASMVEKEAVKDRERPAIARVFYNRLRKKMKLQSDPTCIYPPRQPGEKPSPARCKDDTNKYSTYMIPGLPPGPITTISEASMAAVLQPYSGPDSASILYFVARNDGSWTHYFSKTYREHQVAVDHFLKGKKSRPAGTEQPN